MPTKHPELGNQGRVELGVTDDRWVSDPKNDAGGNEIGAAAAALEPWIVELLACPVDRGEVRLDQTELVCIQCGRRYPVLSGVPRMVADRGSEEQEF
jgi:uncharacterized protein YbaR (Trm112 family)